MSGVLLSLHWQEKRISRQGFQRMLAALDHRGPDGQAIVWRPWAALGHQHFWTTPEEVGEEQPLCSRDGRFCLALDGRLDNRPELLRLLGTVEADPPLSDAALTLLAFEKWGESCFQHLLGPFAVVILDIPNRRVIASRDALGDRTLFYYQDSSVLILASEEHIVCGHDSVSSRLDEITAARFFALEAPLPGHTSFRDVSELQAGHTLIANERGCRQVPHWRPHPPSRPKGFKDREMVEQFRAVLVESVRCRLRAVTQPAVLMSGGMDSTSIAALAAKEISNGQGPGPLQTISWVFDELPLADEREFIHPVVERFALASLEISGDREWPLKGGRAGLYPGSPLDDIYRLLRTSAYAGARDLGARVLLAGTYGDNLFYGYDRWLNSLFREGRIVQALRCVLAELGGASSLGAGLLLLRSRLARLAGWPGRPSILPQWLTPTAAELAKPKGQGAPALGKLRKQARMALDPRISWGLNVEAAYAAHAGLEMRYPFRDRRLVELSLSLPEHMLHRPPWGKWVLREAMAGLLPEKTRQRLHESSLHPLAWRGLLDRERVAVEAILQGPDATWMNYVSKDWLMSFWAENQPPDAGGAGGLVLWLCISWELWRRRLPESGNGPGSPAGVA